MATSREQARAELRRSIDVLPERTRRAMLHGLGNNTVITGAFAASGQGACPMMVAHREGGRTSCCTFPEAWDKFTGVYGRHIVREATPYEIQILCEEIEASLVPLPKVDPLADAIAEHQAMVAARLREPEVVAQQAVVEPEEAPAPPRKRRLRITGGHIDLSEAIAEHKSAARSRRSREADDLGIDWLFEETLVLPDDFARTPAGEPEAPAPAGEYGLGAADAQLTR